MRILLPSVLLALLAGCGGSSTARGPGDGGLFVTPGTGVGGTVANGGACNVDQDCMAGSCVYDDACPGTCLAYRKSGESCGSSVYGGGSCTVNGAPVACGVSTGECQPDAGLSCDPEDLTCEPTPTPGPLVGPGASCSIFGAQCDLTLYCAGPFPDNGTCEPFVQNGGACPPDNPQACDGLLCVGFGSSPDAGVCRPPAPVGGACVAPSAATGSNGSSGCDSNLACVDGKCVATPTSGPCLQGACDAKTSYCDPSNTCQPLQPDGTSCTSAVQCQSNGCDLTHHCGATLCPTTGVH